MFRCASELGDVLLGGNCCRFDDSALSVCGDVAIIKILCLISFQPKRRALAASDAECDQCPFGFAAMQFFKAGEHQTSAGRPNWMTQRNGAAVHVQFFDGNFPG